MAAAETPPPWLHATAMTPSGLPKLMEGEITYIVKQGADVVVGEAKLTAIQVTSHRVMFFAAASAAGRQQVHICGDLAAVTAATVEPAHTKSPMPSSKAAMPHGRAGARIAAA